MSKRIRLKKAVIEKLSKGAVSSVEDPVVMNAHLRRANRMLLRANHHLQEELGDWHSFIMDIASVVVALPPIKRTYRELEPSKKTKVVAVLKLSDWHIGEIVKANETEGFNAFNWNIAQRRMYQIVEDFMKWVNVQREAYIIEECALFCEGDYVSGDIHYELQVTNEFPLPVQTAKAGLLLGEVYRIISGGFKKVHVKFVGSDNHGRLVRKPQAKQKTTNNMSYLVHELGRAYAANCTNIDYEVAEGMKLLTQVNGVTFLIEHADQIKGWAGIPFYGFERMFAKEASRRMTNGKGFHFWSTAHFHTPFFLQNRHVGNGSLSGTSEFDHSQGRHAAPCQVAFLVHPKHHLFNYTPFIGL